MRARAHGREPVCAVSMGAADDGQRQPPSAGAFGVAWVLSDLSYVLVAAAMWLLLPGGQPLSASVVVAAVAVFVLASTVVLPLRVGVASGLQSCSSSR